MFDEALRVAFESVAEIFLKNGKICLDFGCYAIYL